MLLVLIMVALGGVAAILPGRAAFISAGLVAVAFYVFVANIPESVFGIDEFVRYSKEPIIISVILRFITQGYFQMWSASMRNFSAHYQVNGAGGVPYVVSLTGVTKATKRLLAVVVIWSLMSLVLTGIEGFLGYVRGIIFPIFFCLYLNSVDDKEILSICQNVGKFALAFLLFLSFCSYVHLSIDPSFLIDSSFRNRLDYNAPYQTLVAYDSVVRYQSFFGDPNRAALVFLIAMWFSKFYGAKLIHICAILVTIGLVWLTESRTGMLIAFVWLLYQIFERRKFKVGLLLVGSFFFAAVALFVVWSSHSTRSGAVEEVSRDIIWKAVVTHLLGSPHKLLIGEGFGWVGQSGGNRVAVESVQLTSSSGGESALNVIDNSYLTLVSSLGLIGFVPLVFLYRNALRYIKCSCVGAGQYRDVLFLGALILVWSLTFDALVSFPWTFLFPLLLKFYAVRR